MSGIDSIGSEFCAVVEDGDFILVFALDDNDEGKLIKQIEIEDVKRINIGVEASNKKSMIGRGLVGGLLSRTMGCIPRALSASLDSKCTSISIIENNIWRHCF